MIEPVFRSWIRMVKLKLLGTQMLMKSWCTPKNEAVIGQVLDVLIPLISVTLLLTACGNAVASGVLLYDDMESVLRQVSDDVATQYTKPTVNFSTEENLKTYNMLLQPMAHVLFWHQVLIIANQAILLTSFSCGSTFLKHLSMVAMAVLAAYEIILHISWNEQTRNTQYSEILKTLSNLAPEYRGANSTNLATLLFNYIQANFHCCGVYTFTEWFNPSLNWSRTITYGPHTYQLSLPISCCPHVSQETVPDCALSCATEEPHLQGCVNYFSTMPLFRITWIPEEHYATVYLALHVLLLFMYLVNTVLEGRSKRYFLSLGSHKRLMNSTQLKCENDADESKQV